MIISNLPVNLLKLLSGEGLFNLPAQLFQSLKEGQVFQGQVIHVLDDGKAVIQFEGKRFLADPQISLKDGQEVTLKLEHNGRTPVLKIVSSPAQSPSATEEGSDPGNIKTVNRENGFVVRISPGDKQPVELSVASRTPHSGPDTNKPLDVITPSDSNAPLFKVGGRDFAVKYAGNSVPAASTAGRPEPSPDSTMSPIQGKLLNLDVQAGMLKPYLSSRQPLGEMAARLQDMVDNNPVLEQLKIEPGLLGQLRHSLKILAPRDLLPTEDTVKEQIDRSGLRYEAKLKQYLIDMPGNSPGAEKAIAGDLKGQLIHIRNQIESMTLKELHSLPFRQVSELTQVFRQAVDNIELNQLTQQISKQDNQSLLLQLPNPFSQNDKTVKIYFRNLDEDASRGKGKRGRPYNLVFFLDLTQLGAVRIDTQVADQELNVGISVENALLVAFIETFFPEFQEKMKELGFHLTVTCTIKQPEELKAEDTFHQLLVDQSAQLVDIKT